MSEPESTSLIDDSRSTHLCDVGQPDYLAATAVAADGTSDVLLAHRASIGDPTATYDATVPTASHEQTGPLPDTWQDRINAALSSTPPRCHGTTAAGRRCRIRTWNTTGYCANHAQQGAHYE